MLTGFRLRDFTFFGTFVLELLFGTLAWDLCVGTLLGNFVWEICVGTLVWEISLGLLLGNFSGSWGNQAGGAGGTRQAALGEPAGAAHAAQPLRS